jgi:hypothetical protein
MRQLPVVFLLTASIAGPEGAALLARWSPGPLGPGYAQTLHRRFIINPGVEQIMVRRAIDGARVRLGRATCDAVLDDFVDRAGRNLRDNLRAIERTAQQYLDEIWFLDGTGFPICDHAYTAAFTTPGSRVVYVCSARFRYVGDTLCGPSGEIIVIHEFLHSLGLGEDPPTSKQITEQVWKRCG